MANPEHLAKLKEGVEAWNAWRSTYPDINPELEEANLQGETLIRADLFGANLIRANLNRTNLREANLRIAILNVANLSGANLSGAQLTRASLIEANLQGANLSYAHFSGASLQDSNLQKANLQGAQLDEASLWGANLSGANLNEVNLSEAKLYGSNLSRTKCIGASFAWADLKRANLSRGNFSLANFSDANLSKADLSEANLSGADLTGVSLVDTNLDYADLTGCRIYGISAWDARLNNTKQTNLIITPENDPAITVDNLEVAQFIYLLLRYEKLRDVLNTITKRGVLLLGRFGDGGLELLHAIAGKLREFNYLPIIFDFDRPNSRNLTETVKTLVGLSRFVIVELSGPSVPQELYATVPHFKIPFCPIIRKGSRPYAMFSDLLENDWVFPPIEFENSEHLLELMPLKIIKPAEDKARERQERLSKIFD